MKQALPNILKFIGALAVTTAIFFVLQPEESIDNEVLNASMEFLGKKLLAMAPPEKKHQVEKELESFRERTLNGKISDEHFEGVAVAILNAEAEGRQLDTKEIDSLLTAERRKKVKEETKRDYRGRKQEWRDLAERLEAYKEFEIRMKEMVPPEAVPPDLPPSRPLYRVSRNFVVEIDTAAIAEMAELHAKRFAARAPRVMVMPHEEAFRDLARELPALKFEMRRIEMEMHRNDSLKAMMDSAQVHMAVQMKIADSLRRVFEHNPKFQKQMQWGWIYKQRADSIRKAHERYWREHPEAVPPPPPSPPEETNKPKEEKPPE